MSENARELPLLRTDIKIVPSPPICGMPTYLIYDTVSGVYEQADWRQIEILRRLPYNHTFESLEKDILENTTVRVTHEEVEEFLKGIVLKGLTKATAVKSAEQLCEEKSRMTQSWYKKMIHGYLYFRVPLVKPDHFLESTVDIVRSLASKMAFAIYTALGVMGLYFLTMRFDEYIYTFPQFFSLHGAFLYSVTIIVLKLIHEFSHAYVAKAQGVRVSSMGVAFMVMWPVIFSDVTDAWRLKDRKKRLAISYAGVAAEMVIAAVSLFCWGIAPAGMWQSLFFILSSVTVLSTILVNLNPAMRFDGYYLLMDTLKIDNLQQRAFAYTRWLYRKLLLGIEVSCPENMCTPTQLKQMVVYSFIVWIYRFFLYLGIAVMVYYKFTKLLGTILFAIEIYMFILMPVVKEIIVLKKMREQMTNMRRVKMTALTASIAVCFLIVPLPKKLSIPAVTDAVQRQMIYSPAPGEIGEINLVEGDRVEQGQLLCVLNTKSLQLQYQEICAKLKRTSSIFDDVMADERKRQSLLQVSEQVELLEASKSRLEQLINNNNIYADIDGEIVYAADGVRAGTFVSQRQLLGEVNGDKKRVIAFIGEEYSNEIAVGDEVSFQPSDYSGHLKGVVTAVTNAPVEYLAFPQLNTDNGGVITVTQGNYGKQKMVETYYQVVIEQSSKSNLPAGQTGEVSFYSSPRSRLLDLFRYAMGILTRELNL